MAFLSEGQVGCFREDRLVSDKSVGAILKVRRRCLMLEFYFLVSKYRLYT